jgi:hypothetical protein
MISGCTLREVSLLPYFTGYQVVAVGVGPVRVEFEPPKAPVSGGSVSSNTNEVPSQPVVSTVCTSMHLGAGKRFSITIQNNCYYHFNVACSGCQAGEENNYVYYGGGTVSVIVPEGSGGNMVMNLIGKCVLMQ